MTVEHNNNNNYNNNNNNNNNYYYYYYYYYYYKRKEGDGRKHQESIRESYCDRDSKDLHTGICANPQKGA